MRLPMEHHRQTQITTQHVHQVGVVVVAVHSIRHASSLALALMVNVFLNPYWIAVAMSQSLISAQSAVHWAMVELEFSVAAAACVGSELAAISVDMDVAAEDLLNFGL